MYGSVVSEAPLYVRTSDAEVSGYTFPKPVILLWRQDETILKGEGDAVACHAHEGAWAIELRDLRWEDLERRRHPRFPMSVPVALRAVQEHGGDTVISIFQGNTIDLSLGGAWVDVSQAVAVGCLVEFYAHLTPTESIRALGVVAHSSTGRGIGVQFLDFVGSSHTVLHKFLQQAA